MVSAESAHGRPGPPHASSFASPTEFFTDECVGKSVRKVLTDHGYSVHTHAMLYGSREAGTGALDVDWLRDVSPHRWTVLTRDRRIFERPAELEAYRASKLQVFLLPGQTNFAELAELVAANLAEICAIASTRQPGVWRLTKDGPQPYDIPKRHNR